MNCEPSTLVFFTIFALIAATVAGASSKNDTANADIVDTAVAAGSFNTLRRWQLGCTEGGPPQQPISARRTLRRA